MSNLTLHQLKIASITRETPDAVSLTFDVPTHLRDTFAFAAGQYITLELPMGGELVRRAYSMSSAPHENRLTVTVKQVKGGRVSTYINEQLTEGGVVNVLPPQGKFTTPLAVPNRRTFYLLGGGSGITPLFSLLKAVLEQEPQSTVHLLYGNATEESIIFRDDLDALQRRYEGQLHVTHLLSHPKQEKGSGMFSFMKKSLTAWTGLVGIPDTKTITRWLDDSPAHTTESVFFTCGPLPMMQNLEKVVQQRGIDKKHFHMEVFDTGGVLPKAEAGAMAAELHATLNGKKIEVSVAAGQTLLDAMLKAGHDAPFSCKSGACSTCIAKLSQGKVLMDACFALDDDEIAKGYILACQAKPTTAEIVVNFDV